MALRKVEALLASGAEVHVVSETICPGLMRLAEEGAVMAELRRYRPGDLLGAFIAVASTDDPATNLQVAREARAESALVNVVDDADHSDFIAPSVLKRGDITIAVSTGGSSPALARKIRTMLEEHFCDEYADLSVLLGDVRAEVKASGSEVSADAWQRAIEVDRLLDLLREGRREAARLLLMANLKRQSRRRAEKPPTVSEA